MDTDMPELRNMSRLLAPANRRTLLHWLQDDTLFAFDFDGTLAPIVQDPENAFMPRPTWRALAALSTLARVAVISGRGLTDLHRRLPAEVSYVIGNHGNEGRPVEDAGHRGEQERCCRGWMDQLATLRAQSPQWRHILGCVIENKGLTLSLHYRHCADQEKARLVLTQFAEMLTPQAQLVDGLAVINVLPPRARNKSDALTMLMAHSGCARALYVGDDTTDELAFAGAPEHWLTARVGYQGQSSARFRLANTREVRTLLDLAVRQRQATSPQAVSLAWPWC